jgi:hypothetical protein
VLGVKIRNSFDFPLVLLLHLHVLQVQQGVLATAEVRRCEHGHRQPQEWGHGFAPGGTR